MGLKGVEFSERRKQADITSKRLMITRLKNIQVGVGQYLYKASRPNQSTKSLVQTKNEGVGPRI